MRSWVPGAQKKLWRAWRKIDRGIVRLADDHTRRRRGRSRSIAPTAGRSSPASCMARMPAAFSCRRSASRISPMLDSEDRFVAGGYGALVERAAAGVSPRLGVTVRAIHETARASASRRTRRDRGPAVLVPPCRRRCSPARRSASRRAMPRPPEGELRGAAGPLPQHGPTSVSSLRWAMIPSPRSATGPSPAE